MSQEWGQHHSKHQQRYSIRETLAPYVHIINNGAFFAAGGVTSLLLRKVVWSRRREPFYWWLGRRDHGRARPAGLEPFVDQVLDRKGYAIGYNYGYKSPLYASFIITADMVQGKGANDEGGVRIEPFAADGDVPPRHRPRVVDFTASSGFHRGHLAARASVGFSPAAARETFLLSNVCLMTPYCNGVAFKRIEHLTRQWALTFEGPLAVTTGPIFSKGPSAVERLTAPTNGAAKATPQAPAATSSPAAPPHVGAPIADAFYYSVLHIASGNTIAFVVRNAEKAAQPHPHAEGKSVSSSSPVKASPRPTPVAPTSAAQTPSATKVHKPPKESKSKGGGWGDAAKVSDGARNSKPLESPSAPVVEEASPADHHHHDHHHVRSGTTTSSTAFRHNIAIMSLEQLEAKLSGIYSANERELLACGGSAATSCPPTQNMAPNDHFTVAEETNCSPKTAVNTNTAEETVTSSVEKPTETTRVLSTKKKGTSAKSKGDTKAKAAANTATADTPIGSAGVITPATSAGSAAAASTSSNTPASYNPPVKKIEPADNEEDTIFLNDNSFTTRLWRGVKGILMLPFTTVRYAFKAVLWFLNTLLGFALWGGKPSASEHSVKVRLFSRYDRNNVVSRMLWRFMIVANGRQRGPAVKRSVVDRKFWGI